MSSSDVLGNMFVTIMNGGKTFKNDVTVIYSKEKESILKILQKEGFLKNIDVLEDGKKKYLKISLKYAGKKHVIGNIERISRPGRRKQFQKAEIPRVRNGYGIMILSTSKGVLSGKEARLTGVGGEAICKVW